MKENKSVNVVNQDIPHDLNDIETLDKDQVSICSKIYSDSDSENLEILIQEKIQNILKVNHAQYDENCDLIKLLGDFLKIQHYNTDIFSGWILRSILQQVIYHADTLKKCDYTLFIYWIFEEINLIRYTADMTKEHFFRLINEIYRMAMLKILEGKGLLHLLELINHFWEEENESFSKINIPKCDSDITFSTKYEGESTTDTEIADPQFQSTIKYFEKVLHAIINATYELVGSETDFALIQIASIDEENTLNYTIPYHFRKPKVVTKADAIRKLPNNSNSKQAKTIKKRKSIRKNSSDNILTSNSSFNNFKQNNFILPLSDAILCQDFTELVE